MSVVVSFERESERERGEVVESEWVSSRREGGQKLMGKWRKVGKKEV